MQDENKVLNPAYTIADNLASCFEEIRKSTTEEERKNAEVFKDENIQKLIEYAEEQPVPEDTLNSIFLYAEGIKGFWLQQSKDPYFEPLSGMFKNTARNYQGVADVVTEELWNRQYPDGCPESDFFNKSPNDSFEQ